ncbi:hypothetical protein GIB67_004273 [Kingdonia uniflora]|uniref:DUF4228 domain-containing protein n=1 Tax=Kingdonia uniflora TaxID=39325 RepID=A0A7J7MQZ6_9MAGN|nr:hypothetical protein GIB67_004273 [Kingdonia uniflora]
MGNCQTIDAATLMIQHPNGRVERLYWPVTASEVMKINPGHYVALIISFTLPNKPGDKPATETKEDHGDIPGVRVTRVKLLKPPEILVPGQAYRLITSEEVMEGLWAKKFAKKKKKEVESSSAEKPTRAKASKKHQGEVKTEAGKELRTANAASVRSKQWRPSLKSISEAGLPQNTS